MEAEEILKKAAKFNGKTYPENGLIKDRDQANSQVRYNEFCLKLKEYDVLFALKQWRQIQYTDNYIQ